MQFALNRVQRKEFTSDATFPWWLDCKCRMPGRLCPDRSPKSTLQTLGETTMHSATAVAPVLQREMEDPLAYLPFAPIVEYAKGRVIYSQDEVSNNLYLVIGGRVKVSRLADNGDQVVIDIFQTDDFFGESSFLQMPRHGDQAVALENTKLMAWSSHTLTEIMNRRPGLAIALLQILAQRTNAFTERVESFCSDTIPRRLARSLVRLANRLGTPDENGGMRMG